MTGPPVADPEDISGIDEREIHVIDQLIAAVGELLERPPPVVDGVRGRLRAALRKRPSTPGPPGP